MKRKRAWEQTWMPTWTLSSGPELSFPHEASKWSGAVSGFVDIYLIFCYSWNYVCNMFSVEVANVSGRQGGYVHWLWFCQWVGDLCVCFPTDMVSSGLRQLSRLSIHQSRPICLGPLSTCQSPDNEGRTLWKISSDGLPSLSLQPALGLQYLLRSLQALYA